MQNELTPARAALGDTAAADAHPPLAALRQRLFAPAARALWIAAGYLVWLTAAELGSTLGDQRVGLVLHALLLLTLLYHAARDLDNPLHQLLLTLAFAPLIRMISFSLPLATFPQMSWYFIVSLPLFAAAYLVSRLLGYGRRELGLRVGSWPTQLLVALTGITFGYVEYRILAPEPLAVAFSWQALWLPALILLVSTGFLEELIFRGLMQQAGQAALGRAGIVYVSLVFAILHVGYKSVVDVIFVFVVALFFGWIVAKTRSLLGVTLAHGLTNIMLFLVMPYLARG